MARAAYVVLCIAGMVGFYSAVKALEWGLTRGEFIAFASGVATTIIIFAAADRIERREKRQRERA